MIYEIGLVNSNKKTWISYCVCKFPETKYFLDFTEDIKSFYEISQKYGTPELYQTSFTFSETVNLNIFDYNDEKPLMFKTIREMRFDRNNIGCEITLPSNYIYHKNIHEAPPHILNLIEETLSIHYPTLFTSFAHQPFLK